MRNMKTLGKRLKIVRKNKNILQKDAAKMLGISTSVLSNYERDYRDPPTKRLRKMALFYDVSVDYLLGITNMKRSIQNYYEFDQMYEKLIKFEEPRSKLMKQITKKFL